MTIFLRHGSQRTVTHVWLANNRGSWSYKASLVPRLPCGTRGACPLHRGDIYVGHARMCGAGHMQLFAIGIGMVIDRQSADSQTPEFLGVETGLRQLKDSPTATGARSVLRRRCGACVTPDAEGGFGCRRENRRENQTGGNPGN